MHTYNIVLGVLKIYSFLASLKRDGVTIKID